MEEERWLRHCRQRQLVPRPCARMSMFIQEAQRTAWLSPEEDGDGGLHWLWELIELTLEGLQGHGEVQLPARAIGHPFRVQHRKAV